MESCGHGMILQLESNPNKHWVCPEECEVQRECEQVRPVWSSRRSGAEKQTSQQH